jgi:hypothetical protein
MSNFHVITTFCIEHVLATAIARNLLVGCWFNTKRCVSGVVNDLTALIDVHNVAVIECYDGWLVAEVELGSFLITPTLFLDSRVPNDTFFPIVAYKELDCARVAEGIEHGDGAGYICNCCQQEVRFYNAGPDSTRWACNCE